MMKNLLSVFLFFFVSVVVLGTEKQCLINFSFDDIAENSFSIPGIEVEKSGTFEWREAVFGKGLLIDPANDAVLKYIFKDSFPSVCGSFSFWMKPVDWWGETKMHCIFFQIFFRTEKSTPNTVLRFICYKYYGKLGLNCYFFLPKIKRGVSYPEEKILSWRDKWHYIVFSWKKVKDNDTGTVLNLFIDGQNVDSRFPKELLIIPGSAELRILPPWKKTEKCIIDSFSLYDYPLSQDEITENYIKGIKALKKRKGKK